MIQPAIDLAEKGVVLTEREALGLNRTRSTFAEVNGPESPYFKHPEGREWKTGDLLVQADLGKTLRAIQKDGRDGFYRGAVADLLIQEMQRGGGIITQKDLDQYHSAWREPIREAYKNYHIITMPLSSSGGVALIQLMRLVEPFLSKNGDGIKIRRYK